MIPELQRDTPVSPQSEVTQWSQATKIAFRFAFSYLLLYVGPGAVGSLSSYVKPEALENNIWVKIWHPIVPWVGSHVLGLTGNLAEVPNGSGDELYDYVLIFCMVLAAIAITAVWSALDRKRTNYKQLYLWFRVFMRLVTGWAMLGYGVKKLVGSQFPPPDLVRLTQPFGQASPMGMLWTFMGVSALYSFFGGFGETVGGILLMFPRFTTLGALVSGALMTNVLMLNLCYDVPRKIFSIHLVVMCLILLIPDFKRLANVLVLNRQADPVPEVPLFDDKVLNHVALWAQIAFGAYVLWVAGSQSLLDAKTERDTMPAPVRGVWSVTEFNEDGILHPPLLTDQDRWQNVIFDSPKVLTVIGMDGSRQRYFIQFEDGMKTAKLWNLDDTHRTALLSLDYSTPSQMTVNGRFESHQLSAKLDRIDMSDPKKYPLMNKGFHWVNPYIDNR
jgi:uncharacterized membrane protein YphA (DoxX/SURF4 family)